MRRPLALLVVLGLLLAACSSDPTASQEYKELEQKLADSEQSLAEVSAERDNLAAQIAEEVSSEEADTLPPAVEVFKAAYESGDLETIKALFTDDGILTTTDNVHDLYWGGEGHLGTWDKEGAEFRRLASIHRGEMFIADVVEVGDRTVAFDWEWQDFASGTAVLHLRGDKIAVAVLSVTQVEIPER